MGTHLQSSMLVNFVGHCIENWRKVSKYKSGLKIYKSNIHTKFSHLKNIINMNNNIMLAYWYI